MNINMVAPYQGLLYWVGQPASGVSQNSGETWKSLDFTIKYLDSQMREQFIVFSAFGTEIVDRILATPLGTEVRVSWRPSSRSWTDQQNQTRWFPQFSAFGFVLVPNEQAQAPAPAQQAQYGGAPQQNAGFQQPRQPLYQQAQNIPSQAPQTQAAPVSTPNAKPDDLPF